MAYHSQWTCTHVMCWALLPLNRMGPVLLACEVLGANHKRRPLLPLAGACSPDEASQKLLTLLTTLETLVSVHLQEGVVSAGRGIVDVTACEEA